MTGERCSFVRYALHEIAIAANGIRIVIHDTVAGPVVAGCQPSFGDRQADSVPETLPQRTSGYFDARRMTALGMSRRPAAPLAETLELLQRQIITGQVQ